MEDYDLVQVALSYDRIPVTEYVSRRTGITVMIAEVDGPAASACFHLLTEVLEDGLPNALAHLIFMGSEEYPYKDIPNLIVDSGLGSEISKRIDVDHTSYVIETILAEGLLTVLPIIGDYILFPLLKEESFLTEVHHITQEGEDDGEMYQDLNPYDIYKFNLFNSFRQKIYPSDCSYSGDPHGTRKSVRESITLAKVKDYHEKYYRPENLKIVIIGNIEAEKVFKSLRKLEDKIVSRVSEYNKFQITNDYLKLYDAV